MSMKRQLEDRAYLLACWDAAKQAKSGEKQIELELTAAELLVHQYEWYMERAARLWGRS